MKNYITTSIAILFLLGIICTVDAREKIPEEKPISTHTQQIQPVEPVDAITVLVDSYKSVPYAEFIDMIVNACERMDIAKSTQLLVELSKRLDKTVFIDIMIALLKRSEYIDPIKLREWYQAIPFDSGTGLWAIGQKAKKYAEDGNAKRVAEMLELYNKILKEYKEK